MKKFLFITGIILVIFACSTEKMDFNKLQDRNGLYYLVNEEKPYSGEVVAYVNGKTEFEGTIKSGLKEGTWMYYYPNGQKKMECSFKDGLKEGTWTYWKENGQQDMVEIYKYGKLLTNEGTVADTVKKDTIVNAVEGQKPAPATEKKEEKKPVPVVWERLHGGPVKYLDGVPYTGPVVKYLRGGGKELDGYFVRGHRSGKWTYYDKYGNVKDVRYY